MLAPSQALARDMILSEKSFSAVRTDSAPAIDGHLDEPLWQEAAIIDDMHEVRPNEFGEPSEKTRFYVIYGDDAMYVGAEFFDSEPDRVVARVLRQGDWSEGDDGLKVILDPFNQGRAGYVFYLNPHGVRAEGLFRNVTETNWDWRGIWNGAAQLNGQGWTAEIAIPFKTL